MPSHNFMNLLATHNAKHGIRLSFSELKKTSRRIERAYNERPDKDQIDPYAYVLQYRDDTGETATDDYDSERECNRVAAAQRIASRTH
ncbi:MAG: hypothetical protein ACTHJ9_13835 [Rhodanobacter sp.]